MFYSSSAYGHNNALQADRLIGMYIASVGTAASFPAADKPSYLFYACPHWPGRIESFFNTVEKDWKARGKSGAPVIGFNSLSIGTLPKLYHRALELSSKKRGWKYVDTYSPAVPTDSSTEVLKMKNAGVDYILIMTTETGSILPIKEMKRQNYSPTGIYGISTMGTPGFFSALGESAVGVRSMSYSSIWSDTDVEGIKLIHDLNAKWHPEVKHMPYHYITAFAYALAMKEALTRAINKVGFEKLDGEAIRQAMETLNNHQAMGLVPGWTWTTTDHQGIPYLKWYEWKADGSQKPVTDWDPVFVFTPEQRTDEYWTKY
jgi:hypothetical protein